MSKDRGNVMYSIPMDIGETGRFIAKWTLGITGNYGETNEINTWYLDTVNGNDSNTGLSRYFPMLTTLALVNAVKLANKTYNKLIDLSPSGSSVFVASQWTNTQFPFSDVICESISNTQVWVGTIASQMVSIKGGTQISSGSSFSGAFFDCYLISCQDNSVLNGNSVLSSSNSFSADNCTFFGNSKINTKYCSFGSGIVNQGNLTIKTYTFGSSNMSMSHKSGTLEIDTVEYYFGTIIAESSSIAVSPYTDDTVRTRIRIKASENWRHQSTELEPTPLLQLSAIQGAALDYVVIMDYIDESTDTIEILSGSAGIISGKVIELLKYEYGSTGLQGETGIGEKGLQGETGLEGIKGSTGLQGETGISISGTQGLTGINGIPGEQGATGLVGETGIEGSKGSTGLNGIQGETGVGEQGLTGVSVIGLQGETGVQGIQGIGIDGATGLVGVTGINGIKGETGLQGFTGVSIIGAQGSTGVSIVGSQGETGLDGLIGSTGLQGETGFGLNGQQGSTGVQGIGEQGVTGLIGSTGASIKGDQGSQGVTGIVGISGATGINGIQGVTGLDNIESLNAEIEARITSDSYMLSNSCPNIRYGLLNSRLYSIINDGTKTILGSTGLASISICFGYDGFLYGVGAPGLVSKIDSNVNEVPITTTSRNFSSICQGSDGYLYASVASGGGSDGFIYRILLDGTDTAITTTSRDWASICQGYDGYLYGAVVNGYIYSISTDGTEVAITTTSRNWRSICQGSDGYLYGAAITDYIYRILLDGTEAAITTTPKNWKSICQGSDENLYGAAAPDHIYSISLNGIQTGITTAYDTWGFICQVTSNHIPIISEVARAEKSEGLSLTVIQYDEYNFDLTMAGFGNIYYVDSTKTITLPDTAPTGLVIYITSAGGYLSSEVPPTESKIRFTDVSGYILQIVYLYSTNASGGKNIRCVKCIKKETGWLVI